MTTNIDVKYLIEHICIVVFSLYPHELKYTNMNTRFVYNMFGPNYIYNYGSNNKRHSRSFGWTDFFRTWFNHLNVMSFYVFIAEEQKHGKHMSASMNIKQYSSKQYCWVSVIIQRSFHSPNNELNRWRYTNFT